MAEYIEREAFLAHIEDLPTWGADGEFFDREDVLSSVENAPAANVAPVVCKPMRVEVEKLRGEYYREHYFCPSCDIEIGHRTFDAKWCFGQGTVLHSNKFPNYCPNCGAKMDATDINVGDKGGDVIAAK